MWAGMTTPIESDMYPFKNDDAGRSKSSRPLQKQDCVIRSFALAFNIPYDQSYDSFKAAGRRSHAGTHKNIWKAQLAKHPCVVKTSFPAVKGKPRMNLPAFCNQFRCGRYIVQMAGHLTAVINGVVHDTFAPDETRCIYAVWKVG